jgi:hypothetical protein
MGRLSRRRRRRSFRFLLRSRRASLLASVSFAGVLADSSSAEMSSRYQSSAVPEGPSVSPAAMKTWAIGVAKTRIRARHLCWGVLLSSSEWCSLLEGK